MENLNYWNGLPFPSLGPLPDPEKEHKSQSPELAGRFFTTGASWEAPEFDCCVLIQFKDNIYLYANSYSNTDIE